MEALTVGTTCDLLIEDLSQDGQGIGRRDGVVVFVPGALPGERVRVRLARRARRHWCAQLERILDSSPSRRRPPCILAESCGGCSLQHLDPEAQLRWKRTAVREALRRLGGIDHPVEPVLAAPASLAYRNRAIIPLERLEDGGVRCGYYRRGSHRIVNLNRCPVLDSRIDGLVQPIKADLAATDWPIDRDCRNGGGLRHLALRVGSRTGEVLISLISSHDRLPGLEAMARTWLDRWPTVVGVTLNLQPLASNLLLGPDTRVLAGRPVLHEQFAGHQLAIATDTFFQVYSDQAERVVPLLLEELAAGPPGLVIDAYCGIGTFSLPMAAAGWRVLGLELNPAAVQLAQQNARDNGLEASCDFEACDVAEVLMERLPQADGLVVDPPRRGLDPAVLSAVVNHPPPRLLYLSCDPASLARDLSPLVNGGPMQLQSVRPIEFFPHTTHVETLAVLTRRA